MKHLQFLLFPHLFSMVELNIRGIAGRKAKPQQTTITRDHLMVVGMNAHGNECQKDHGMKVHSMKAHVMKAHVIKVHVIKANFMNAHVMNIMAWTGQWSVTNCHLCL